MLASASAKQARKSAQDPIETLCSEWKHLAVTQYGQRRYDVAGEARKKREIDRGVSLAECSWRGGRSPINCLYEEWLIKQGRVKMYALWYAQIRSIEKIAHRHFVARRVVLKICLQLYWSGG